MPSSPPSLARPRQLLAGTVDALPLDIFRVLVGVLAFAYFLRTFIEARDFSGPAGLIDHELSRELFWFTRLSLFQREAVKPFVTDEVYRGAKRPFFAPPTTLRVGNPMYELLQDLLRSRVFSSVPFFEQTSVIGLLDELPRMDDETRAAMDPVIFMMASTCVLQDRYGL